MGNVSLQRRGSGERTYIERFSETRRLVEKRAAGISRVVEVDSPFGKDCSLSEGDGPKNKDRNERGGTHRKEWL